MGVWYYLCLRKQNDENKDNWIKIDLGSLSPFELDKFVQEPGNWETKFLSDDNKKELPYYSKFEAEAQDQYGASYKKFFKIIQNQKEYDEDFFPSVVESQITLSQDYYLFLKLEVFVNHRNELLNVSNDDKTEWTIMNDERFSSYGKKE